MREEPDYVERWDRERQLWPEQNRGEKPKPLSEFRRRATASAEAGWRIVGWCLDLAVVLLLAAFPWALMAAIVAGAILAARWALS